MSSHVYPCAAILLSFSPVGTGMIRCARIYMYSHKSGTIPYTYLGAGLWYMYINNMRFDESILCDSGEGTLMCEKNMDDDS